MIQIVEDGDMDYAKTLPTVLDELKLEAFLAGYDKKSLEEIQEFFKH